MTGAYRRANSVRSSALPAAAPPISVQHVETGELTRVEGSGHAGNGNRGSERAARDAVVLWNYPICPFFEILGTSRRRRVEFERGR